MCVMLVEEARAALRVERCGGGGDAAAPTEEAATEADESRAALREAFDGTLALLCVAHGHERPPKYCDLLGPE